MGSWIISYMRMKAPHWKRVKWEDLKWKIFHLQWMNKTFPQLRCYYLNQFWYACEMRKINLENSSESFQSSRKSIEIASHPLLIQDSTIEDDEEDGWMKIELMPNSIILNSPSALSLTCVGEVCYSSPPNSPLHFSQEPLMISFCEMRWKTEEWRMFELFWNNDEQVFNLLNSLNSSSGFGYEMFYFPAGSSSVWVARFPLNR